MSTAKETQLKEAQTTTLHVGTDRHVPLPSQTVGPFFGFALTTKLGPGQMARPGIEGERVWLNIRVMDADGHPLPDSMIELWQADSQGRFNHKGFGFGRLPTSIGGDVMFETIRPGRVKGIKREFQAPHISVSLFARGLLARLCTRIYFAGDPANADDEILNLVPADRRDTLMAHADKNMPGVWAITIHLAGPKETVFFDI
jgi:protocatechuate 3,4-dioxygenase alpha subunit